MLGGIQAGRVRFTLGWSLESGVVELIANAISTVFVAWVLKQHSFAYLAPWQIGFTLLAFIAIAVLVFRVSVGFHIQWWYLEVTVVIIFASADALLELFYG